MTGWDDWSTDGPNVRAPESLENIEATLKDAPVIVEHRFYRGASAPARLVFDDYEELTYLNTNTKAGDAIYVWNFSELCRDDNHLAMGKIPDSSGRTPRGGAY
jgi:hypothetical protein